MPWERTKHPTRRVVFSPLGGWQGWIDDDGDGDGGDDGNDDDDERRDCAV